MKSRFAYAFLGNLLKKLKKKSDRGISSVDVKKEIPISQDNEDVSSTSPMGIENPFNNHPNFRKPINMLTQAIAYQVHHSK